MSKSELRETEHEIGGRSSHVETQHCAVSAVAAMTMSPTLNLTSHLHNHATIQPCLFKLANATHMFYRLFYLQCLRK